ncbi:hypothetical protein DKX38_012406 [Salix brachista]|uniref:Ribulose bisphosphate carboxylase/oxygenase activase, chloroplastic n=1 Tax=Salix brachista TaxID=2182728 RepID=A0A5N5LNB7_9ROSI|nr:hypothetical protein DKX38_012406 [Salix brachista]
MCDLGKLWKFQLTLSMYQLFFALNLKCGVDSSALALEWVVSHSKLVELFKMVEFYIISIHWDSIICQVGLSRVRVADDLNALHLLLWEVIWHQGPFLAKDSKLASILESSYIISHLSILFLEPGTAASAGPEIMFSVMAGAREITGATKILFGNNRKTLYVQRDLPINRRNQLLLGMLRGHRPAFGVSNKRTVSLRFRAQSKPRDFVSGVVTSSVDEQSSLIEKPVLLDFNPEAGALRWLQKETYEPENLGTGSFLEKKMKEGVDCGLTEVTRLGRSRSVGLEEVRYFPVMERGRRALEEINQETGLAFDEQDLHEHNRHWFVTGNIIIDGQPMDRTLMQIVKSTLQANPNNSVIDFKDNSSAIKGFPPRLIIADGSYAPWEDRSFPYPSNLASPLQILIDGSSINGSSDYWRGMVEANYVLWRHRAKGEPDVGMLVVKIGDAEMAQKPYVLYDPALRWVSSSAGCNCNVVKEIIYPKGAQIDIQAIVVGDHTLSVLEICGAEYQEQDAILVKAESRDFLQSIYKSESSRWLLIIGTISGSDLTGALSEAMIELGIAIDGVRDSLSMAAHAGHEIVKAPGNLVTSAYVTFPGITKTITPDLKLRNESLPRYIDLTKFEFCWHEWTKPSTHLELLAHNEELQQENCCQNATWKQSNLNCVAVRNSNTNPQRPRFPVVISPSPRTTEPKSLHLLARSRSTLCITFSINHCCLIMAATISTAGAVNRALLALNGPGAGSTVPTSAFFGNSLKKVSSSRFTNSKISPGSFKVVAEQTEKDRWAGLGTDMSDDQQDITRGKGMVDSLFQAPQGSGTHDPVLSSYEYLSQGQRTSIGTFEEKKRAIPVTLLQVPLILGVWGGKGQGKSFQCELVFAKLGISPIMMSAGELESGNAGEPAKLIRQRYREAADIIKKKGKMCCLFINDLDAGAGRMGGTTQYTVNNQMVNATLMNIADNPTNVQLPGMYNKEDNPRVPIIVTGNDFSTLYAPLIRDGRMDKFYWAPTRDDRIGVCIGIFKTDNVPEDDIVKLVDTFPGQSIDFFGALRARVYDDEVRKWVSGVGVESIGKKLVNSREGPPSFEQPKMTIEKLLEYGNMLVKEQDNVKRVQLADKYLSDAALGEANQDAIESGAFYGQAAQQVKVPVPEGCTDRNAANFDPTARSDDGSCAY